MSLIMGMMVIMSLTPNMQAVAKAQVVGKKVFDVIEREPKIKDKDNCIEDFSLKSRIVFSDVTFRYPTAASKVKNIL